jgi:hypothetical protein
MEPTPLSAESGPRFPFFALAAGLAVAQVAASLHVRISNRALARKAEALAAEGYLVVPGGPAMPDLLSPAAAVGGGLFFALTVGAFLTLAFLAAGIAWHRLYGGSRRFLPAVLLFWAGLFVLMNADGFAGLDNLHLLATPPVAFYLAARRARNGPPSRGIDARPVVHLICFGALVAIGTQTTDAAFFSRVRDRLLSHPAGVAVSDFYYRHTLYPAETFKAPAQMQVRSVRLDASLPEPLSRRLAAELTPRDYLPLSGAGPADLFISGDAEGLRLYHRERFVLETAPAEFFRDPASILRDFSRAADRHAGLRQLTFLSLRLVGGILLYGLFYLPFRRIAGAVVASPVRATAAAGVLACGGALLLLTTLSGPPRFELAPGEVQAALASPSASIRIAALREIHRRGIEIAGFDGFAESAASPVVAERFWLARTLGRSRSRMSWPVHLALLDDPQINVAYNAYASLGSRGDPRGVAEILRRMPDEPRWYVRFYAYRALRRLGWRPSPASP